MGCNALSFQVGRRNWKLLLYQPTEDIVFLIFLNTDILACPMEYSERRSNVTGRSIHNRMFNRFFKLFLGAVTRRRDTWRNHEKVLSSFWANIGEKNARTRIFVWFPVLNANSIEASARDETKHGQSQKLPFLFLSWKLKFFWQEHVHYCIVFDKKNIIIYDILPYVEAALWSEKRSEYSQDRMRPGKNVRWYAGLVPARGRAYRRSRLISFLTSKTRRNIVDLWVDQEMMIGLVHTPLLDTDITDGWTKSTSNSMKPDALVEDGAPFDLRLIRSIPDSRALQLPIYLAGDNGSKALKLYWTPAEFPGVSETVLLRVDRSCESYLLGCLYGL